MAKGGISMTDALLLAGGAYLAWSWYTSTGLFAPSATTSPATSPAAAPVTGSGSYTTALTASNTPAAPASPVTPAGGYTTSLPAPGPAPAPVPVSAAPVTLKTVAQGGVGHGAVGKATSTTSHPATTTSRRPVTSA